jgi:diguanylate cyclase (GGDEF)-like protein/PAS domain S-box-containing protein
VAANAGTHINAAKKILYTLSALQISRMPAFVVTSAWYAISIYFTLEYLTTDGHVSIFWIPGGIALASLISGGWKSALALFFGSVLVFLSIGRPWLNAVQLSAIGVGEAILSCFLLSRLSVNRHRFDLKLKHSRDYLGMLAVTMPVALLSAVLGVLALRGSGANPTQDFALNVLHWWMGGSLGVIIITPLILVWQEPAKSVWNATLRAEALTCFGLCFMAGQIVFLGWFNDAFAAFVNPYWSFLFIAWGSARFGRHGGLLLVGLSVLQAMIGVVHAKGHFAMLGVQYGLMNLWLYALVLTLVGVMLALLIHEKKQAESVALEGEKRHRSLLDWSPEAIGVHRGGRVVYVNQAAIHLFGASCVSQLMGKPIADLIHPDSLSIAMQRARQVIAERVALPMIEEKFVRLDGSAFEVEVQSTPIVFDGLESVHVIIRDVTDTRRSKKFEQFRSKILELLVGDQTLADQLEAIVLGVEQLNPAMLCSVLLLDEEGKHLGRCVAPHLPEFYNAAINGITIGIGVGSCGTAAFTAQRVIVTDIATHPYWAPYKELAREAGLGACWSQPIFSSSGVVLGTFAIYHRDASAPSEADLQLIEQSANLANIAIERNVAAEKLRDSEAHFRLLTEDVADVVWKMDSHYMITYVSPADQRLRGYHADEVIGRHLSELLAGDAAVAVKSIMQKRQQSESEGGLIESETFEVKQRCKDGKTIWMETLSNPERDQQGRIIGYHGISRDISQRKQIESELRIAAIAFESQQGIFVTDAQWVILRVNHAFSEITGYSAQDAFGQTPRLLSSERHDEKFYAEMNAAIARHGTWQGEIWDKRKNGVVFPVWLILTAVNGDDGQVSNYVATISDMTERKAAEEQIETLAFYDSLTGLPNRRLLVNRLEQLMSSASRHKRLGALLFIDLDNFKTLNDTLGHDVGDQLLQQVAGRLGASIRDGDTVARLGGDEFVIMLTDLSENKIEAANQTEMVGAKILNILNQVYQLDSHEHQSTPSIGMTLFGDRAENIEEPLKRADLAMYQAKAAGRNTLRFFDPQMQAEVNARVVLELDLREALAKGQFELYYQVQVAGKFRIQGAEALVRWIHPQRGMVSPLEFIPFAEESGLILPLGNWVLDTACRQLAKWAHQPKMAALTLSVNVSSRQFHQADFVEQVLKVLEETGAKPEKLKLELTESLLISNIEDVIVKMGTLKKIGVGFSLDDFGTGYSSLSYLKRLPLDQLKIDQSFVRDILIDPNDTAIAKMIVVLADSLGLAVIAEGVETEQQRELLAHQGCHAYQGYLFGRPLPLAPFESYVEQAPSFPFSAGVIQASSET